jgi:hypothetical protein
MLLLSGITHSCLSSDQGGLMAGLDDLNGEDEIERMARACRMGAISASFMIEQYGIARFESGMIDGGGGGVIETWNGDLPLDRLNEMEHRR